MGNGFETLVLCGRLGYKERKKKYNLKMCHVNSKNIKKVHRSNKIEIKILIYNIITVYRQHFY